MKLSYNMSCNDRRKSPLLYLGTTIIMPGGANSAIRYIIQRYADNASMRVRKNSQESLKLIEEANNYSTLHYESATGMETWFTLPDLKAIVPPPKWKMANGDKIWATNNINQGKNGVPFYFSLPPY